MVRKKPRQVKSPAALLEPVCSRVALDELRALCSSVQSRGAALAPGADSMHALGGAHGAAVAAVALGPWAEAAAPALLAALAADAHVLLEAIEEAVLTFDEARQGAAEAAAALQKAERGGGLVAPEAHAVAALVADEATGAAAWAREVADNARAAVFGQQSGAQWLKTLRTMERRGAGAWFGSDSLREQCKAALMLAS